MKVLTGLLIGLMIFGCAKKEEPKQPTAKAVEKAPAPKEVAKEEPKEAVKEVKIAEVPITSKSEEAVAAFRKGRDLADNRRSAQAIDEFEKAIKLDPGFAQAMVWLGTYKPDASGVKLVEKAAVLSKELPEAERVLIDLMVAEKRGKLNELRGLAQKLVALAPTDWRAQQELGLVHWREFNLPEVTAAFTKASQLNPEHAQPYNYLGYALAYEGKHKEAVAAAEKFVELKPDEPNAKYALATVYLMAGRLDEAEKNFQKAAETKGFHQGLQGLAMVKFYRGDWEGGYKDFDRAIKAAPSPQDQMSLRWSKLYLLLGQGKVKMALKQLAVLQKDARKAKVDWVSAWAPWFRALVCLLETNKYKQVAGLVDKALKQAEKVGLSGGQLRYVSRLSHLVKVIAACRMKKIPAAEKALKQFEELLKSTPWDTQSVSTLHMARGAVAFTKKDTQGALGHMSKCISEDMLCRWQHAEMLEQSGDKKTAAGIREQLKNHMRNAAFAIYIRSKVIAKGK